MTAPDPRPRSWQRGGARRLTPTADGSRALRWAVLLLGLVLVIGAAGSLATVTWATRVADGEYDDLPAAHELGTPDSLAVAAEVMDITAVRDPEATQVTAALVEPGATTLPATGETVRARVTLGGTKADREVEVDVPRTSHPVPWMTTQRDLLVVIPAEHELALEATNWVGDIEAEGAFTRVMARTSAGDVELRDISVAEDVSVTSEVGDVELSLADSVPGGIDVANPHGDTSVRLAPEAEGDLTVAAGVGDIEVAAPGSGRYAVEAHSEIGETTIDPDLVSGDGEVLGTLIAGSSSGDVTVGR